MTGYRRESIHIHVVRPPKVTDAHRADLLKLLSFGAMPFRGICNTYDEEASRGHRVDRHLVRRTLDSLIGRGEVVAIKTRRPGQQPRKRERKPMTVYAATAVAIRHHGRGYHGWMGGVPSSVALEDHLLALLCVGADATGERTVLTCKTQAQADRVFAEAKRIMGGPASWTRP